MNTDRELLELAAKAAGIAIMPCTCSDKRWPFKHNESVSGKYGHWNPLEDDSDRYRLAKALNMNIDFQAKSVGTKMPDGIYAAICWGALDECKTDADAIVSLAAEIGRQMP